MARQCLPLTKNISDTVSPSLRDPPTPSSLPEPLTTMCASGQSRGRASWMVLGTNYQIVAYTPTLTPNSACASLTIVPQQAPHGVLTTARRSLIIWHSLRRFHHGPARARRLRFPSLGVLPFAVPTVLLHRVHICRPPQALRRQLWRRPHFAM